MKLSCRIAIVVTLLLVLLRQDIVVSGLDGGRPIRTRVRMMTFNVWYSGINVFNGLEKIAKQINIIKPDIVALQEVESSRIDALLNILDGYWTQCNNTVGVPNAPYIISRFPVVRHFRPLQNVRNVGCKLLVDRGYPNLFVNVWNIHLISEPYGPHEACFNKYVQSYWELRDLEEDFDNDYSPKRVNTVRSLIRDEQFLDNLSSWHTEPLILAGDFNSPSHLDWTWDMKEHHCDWTFEWPVTQLLQDNGLRDSFREVHPNPKQEPGLTWSPVVTFNDRYNKTEPQDRIDFIFYKAAKMRPTASRVYQGSSHLKPLPNHATNEWPSDHASVITDFDVYAY